MRYITLLAASLITLSTHAANIDRTGLYSKEELAKNFSDQAALVMYRLNAEKTFTLPSTFVSGPQMMRLTNILCDWRFGMITFNDAQTRINDNYRTTGLANDPNTPDDPVLGAHPLAPKSKAATATITTAAAQPAPATTAAKPPVAPTTPSLYQYLNVVPRAPKTITTITVRPKPTGRAAPDKDHVELVPTANGGTIPLKKLTVD